MSPGTEEEIRALFARMRTIAVLGIKPESHSDQAAYYVPAYMARQGYEIIPVPVYYPDVTEILGRPVFRSLAAIGRPIDLVNVFRRPKDLWGHLDDLLAAKPAAVWLQLGIRDDAFAARLRDAGMMVVQDRCLMVDHREQR
ncbi:MAG: CoA-binding protein [Deltaproteobacteria bacterium]|nr:CoA-binding protein [Deltaproteobacteria bacterium]